MVERLFGRITKRGQPLMARTTKMKGVEAPKEENQRPLEELSIRRIAARFISNNEQAGLNEIDKIASEIYTKNYLKYAVFSWVFTISGAFLVLVVFLLSLIARRTGSQNFVDMLLVLESISGLAFVAAPIYWRLIQYNFGRELKPQPTIYMSGDNSSIENIGKFFEIMQRETTQRPYYYNRNGSIRHLDERYFYGRLRPLLLSKHRWIRELVFSPRGLWFSHEIYMQVDAEALIKQAKAKPNASGRPEIYDYEAILRALIEHPGLSKITPGQHGSIAQLERLIHKVSEEHPDYPECLPKKTQLGEFAAEILENIKKNREFSN